MSIPTESERAAGYRASMAATLAAGGKNVKGSGTTVASVRTDWAGPSPGPGCIQTDDTARHIREISERKATAAANVLTDIERITIDSNARTAAHTAARAQGRSATDSEIRTAIANGMSAAVAAKSAAK